MTSSAGLSRMSSMFFLYATPTSMTRLARTALPCSFNPFHRAGRRDETGFVVERPHLPGEVVRIERDAVTADAGAGRELHETERFRRGGLDDFPHIDAEFVAHDRHFVRE